MVSFTCRQAETITLYFNFLEILLHGESMSIDVSYIIENRPRLGIYKNLESRAATKGFNRRIRFAKDLIAQGEKLNNVQLVLTLYIAPFRRVAAARVQ